MSFEWPQLLPALALVPAVAALYTWSHRRRKAYALRFANLALLDSVVTKSPGFKRHVPPLLYLLSLAALLVSLARPTAVVAVPRDQTTVMLVMDTSGSMSADDISPNRLDAARSAAEAFVEGLPDGAQVGLVAFHHVASVQAAPTRDHDAVAKALGSLRPNGGTAIGDGLQVAVDQLAAARAAGGPPGLVVLLSDGMPTHGSPPADAAAKAREAGVRVHAVGIGQRGAAPVIGQNQIARLDESTLRQIADVTGGTYSYAAEARDLEQVYSDLSAQVAWVEEETEITAVLAGLGSALMLAAGLLSLRWFQRVP
jgi:Ca-activated chloride channel family protein